MLFGCCPGAAVVTAEVDPDDDPDDDPADDDPATPDPEPDPDPDDTAEAEVEVERELSVDIFLAEVVGSAMVMVSPSSLWCPEEEESLSRQLHEDEEEDFLKNDRRRQNCAKAFKDVYCSQGNVKL